MTIYKLTAKTNRYGWRQFRVDVGRDHFEFFLNPYLLSHDILEHTETPHTDPFVDELMAIGGYLARGTHRKVRSKKYTDSVTNFIHYSFNSGLLCSLPDACEEKIQDSGLSWQIKNSIYAGVVGPVGSLMGGNYDRIPEECTRYVDSLYGWISRGYNLFNERFSDPEAVSTVLFNLIPEKCRSWSEGETALLDVNFETLDVSLFPC